MTTNYHTAISVGAAANAATFNSPMGQLDSAISDLDVGVYNVKAYGATGNGSTDDTAAIQSALDAINSAGGGVCLFPPGTYKIDSLSGGVTIYSNTRVTGNWAQIWVNLASANDSSNYRAFYIPDGETDIEIAFLEFYGNNSGPFVPGGNVDHAAIYMPGVGASKPEDISIHHCTFRNLFGFTAHLAGTGYRVHVTDCLMYECANGLNVNAEYSQQANNTLYYCEGIECSGAYANIANNIILYPTTGISLGGTTAGGDTVVGQVVSGNVIADTQNPGHGISINDGCEDTVVVGNMIARSYGSGILVVGGGNNPIKNVLVANNTLRSCGANAASTHIAISVTGSDVDGVKITGNYIHNNADDSSHATTYGVACDAADDVDISENTIETSGGKTISLNGTTNVTVGRNRCDPSKVEFVNSATLIANNFDANGYALAGTWYQDDVSASQTAVALNLVGGGRTEVVMPRAGAIVGIVVYSNAGRSAGTLTVDVTIGGSVTGLQAQLDGTNTDYHAVTQDPYADQFAASNRVGVKITTDGSWAPTTADITVNVLVVMW